jgi:hypothetical protein
MKIRTEIISYNGWKNKETWQVASHIQEDHSTYQKAQEFMDKYKNRSPYKDFIKSSGILGDKFTDKNLSISELNFMMWELRGN